MPVTFQSESANSFPKDVGMPCSLPTSISFQKHVFFGKRKDVFNAALVLRYECVLSRAQILASVDSSGKARFVRAHDWVLIS